MARDDTKVREILFFRKKEVQSLKTLCYDEIFQFCFKMAKYGIDSQQLKDWKIMLKSLPSAFWQDLNLKYGKFWYSLFNVNNLNRIFPRYYDHLALQELEFSLPKGELLPDDDKYLNLAYQFIDENTNSLTFWLQDQDTLPKIISLSEGTTHKPIVNFEISCNQNAISELPKFFSHFQAHLKRLQILAPEGTENLILDFLNQSECQLEDFRLDFQKNGSKLEAKKVRKFLQKQADSLECLNIELSTDVMGKISQQFSQMKKLKRLTIWTDVDYTYADNEDELLELLTRWTEDSIDNDLLQALGKADCPIEDYTWYSSNVSKGKVEAKNISNFMKKHASSLKYLNLTKWLADMESEEIEEIFKLVQKMEKLESINVFALDLIGPNEEDKFHRLAYFNKKDLDLQIDSYRGDIYSAKVVDNMSELAAITQKIPLIASMNCNIITGIISENDATILDTKSSFNKITSLDSDVEPNQNWILDAEWQELQRIYIHQNYDTRDVVINSISPDEVQIFPNLPALTSITIDLYQIPFHYKTFQSLLFGSPNLRNLRIKIKDLNSIIQDFDENDFANKLKINQFHQLQTISLENPHHAIIPFDSLLNLLLASPVINTLNAVLTPNEECILRKKYDLAISKEFTWNINNFTHFSSMIS